MSAVRRQRRWAHGAHWDDFLVGGEHCKLRLQLPYYLERACTLQLSGLGGFGRSMVQDRKNVCE